MTFRINRVYTRTGDQGDTALVGGKRVSKAEPRVAAYGEIDELNSVLGLIKERLPTELSSLREPLEFLQQELFDLGSELATPPSGAYPQMIRITAEHVTRLEHACDNFGAGLPELTSFILPGGSETAALFHVARTVCRRAERRIVALAAEASANPEAALTEPILQYVNRLSDLLFLLARYALKQQNKDAPLWEKGGKPVPKPFTA